MKKFIMMVSIILLPTIAFAEWHQITLTEWKDQNGGGKRGYPKNEQVFQEWHEKGTMLLVNGDMDPKDIIRVHTITLSDDDSKQLKKNMFQLDSTTGVTK